MISSEVFHMYPFLAVSSLLYKFNEFLITRGPKCDKDCLFLIESPEQGNVGTLAGMPGSAA